MTTLDQPSVQPSVPSGPRRTIWPWIAAAAAVLAAAVMAGVTVTLLSSLADGPSAASSPSTGPSPSPSDTTDSDRWACRAASDAGRAEPDTYVAIASVAIESTDPGIAEAGRGLLEAALAAQSAGNTFDELFDATMAIDRAKIDLARACAARFGEGGW
ncbi:MAG: hypothetical protein DIU79_12430 [Actinobacteria bacterium]|nr:MAG: hypothetical protein DIU79_12430 [Actinomycetota bacterium]